MPNNNFESPYKDLDEGSKKMMQLIKQYGGAKNIPAEELGALGYTKTESGIVRSSAQEQADAEREIQRKNREEGLAEKMAKAPFGLIPLNLEVADVQYRKLSEEQADRFEEIIEQILDFGNDGDLFHTLDTIELSGKYVPESSSLIALEKNISSFLEDNLKEYSEDFKKEAMREIFIDNSFYLIAELISEHISEFRKNYAFEYDGNKEMSAVSAEKNFIDLETLKGTLMDLPRLKQSFQQIQEIKTTERVFLSDEQKDFIAANGIRNNLDFTRHFFVKFLEQSGMSEIASLLNSSESAEEIKSSLEGGLDDFLKDLADRERELEKKIKGSALEEKKILSRDLKAIKEERKDKKQIVLGLMDYFNTPKLAVQFFEREINEFQRFLIRKKGDKKAAEYYLDGRFDFEMDKDPGRISGDCTEGAPLPFDHPNIPVYNVKFFDKNKNHIGNIYLLETIEESQTGEKKVWHLDAIQVPSNLDWETAAEVVVKAIADEARKKDISLITVNQEPELISNYDYIRDAVFEYWKKSKKEKTLIHIPEGGSYVSEEGKYSEFQGDGEVLILWKNPDLKSVK